MYELLIDLIQIKQDFALIDEVVDVLHLSDGLLAESFQGDKFLLRLAPGLVDLAEVADSVGIVHSVSAESANSSVLVVVSHTSTVSAIVAIATVAVTSLAVTRMTVTSLTIARMAMGTIASEFVAKASATIGVA